MQIEIPKEALKDLSPTIEEAIVRAIDQAGRTTLAEAAVKALLTPNSNYHSPEYKKTAIQIAFEEAVRNATIRIVEEEVNRPDSPVRIKIEECIRDGVSKFVASDNGGIRDAISSALYRMFKEDR